VNDCVGFAVGGYDAGDAVENVTAWCRSVNTEHAVDFQVRNPRPAMLFSFRQSAVWIFGFKTEMNPDMPFHVSNGSCLEVLGGVFLSMGKRANPTAVVTAEDSRVSIVMACGGAMQPDGAVMLEDRRAGEVRRIPVSRFPAVGRSKAEPLVPLMINCPETNP
jgi:hypothetical protein